MSRKSKKFIISLIVLLTFFAGFNAFASASCNECAESLLESIDVFNYDEGTKDEFVTVAVALETAYNIFETIPVTAKAVYSDVSKSSTCFSAAYWAYNQGIELGENGVLNSDRNITCEELYKILIIAADYDFMLTNQSYPYTRIAHRLSSNFANLTPTSPVTNGEFLEILYEYLFLPATVNLGNRVDVSKDVTILKQYMDIKYDSGVMIANEFSAGNGMNKTKSGQCIVMTDDGKKLVLDGVLKYKDYIGYPVEVFYKENKNINEVVMIVKNTTNEFYIDGEDFLEINLNERKLYYNEITYDGIVEKGKKTKDKRFSFGLTVVYNGQFVNNSVDIYNVVDILNNPQGKTVEKVSLLDIDEDGTYDTLVADVYRYYAPAFVNTTEKFFNDMFYNEFYLNKKDYHYVKEETGEAVDIGIIAKDGLVKIKEGLHEEPLIQIKVTQEKIRGSFHSFVYNDDGTVTALVKIAENSLVSTASTTQTSISFTGGEDGQDDIRRYEVDNSLVAYLDKVMISGDKKVHIYNIILDEEERIGGVTVFNFLQNSWNNHSITTTTYNTVEVGVCLEFKMLEDKPNNYEFTVFTKPKALAGWVTRKYKTSEDFKIKNFKLSGNYETVEVKNLRRYSFDKLKEYFIEEIFEIYLNDKGELESIVLPVDEPVEGKLSRYAPKNLTYIMTGFGTMMRSTTTNDVIKFTNSSANCLIIPKYGTADISLSLARMFQNMHASIRSGALYNISAYTYSYPSATPDFIVWIYDYSKVDALINTDIPAKTGVAVVDRSYRMASDNGGVDAFDVMGGTDTSLHNEKGVMFSVYEDTYETPRYSASVNKVTVTSEDTDVSYTYYQATPFSSVKKFDDPIESGDIVLFTVPFWQTGNPMMRFFTTAHKLYDYGTDTIVDISRLIRGTISIMDETDMFVLPSGKENKRDNYRFYKLPNRIVVFKKYKSGGSVVAGTKEDLMNAYATAKEVFFAYDLVVIYE